MLRVTEAPSPDSAEKLLLTPAEADLGIRAVSYYVTSSLDVLDGNRNISGLHGIYTSAQTAIERLNNTAKFVFQYQTLARKLGDLTEQPHIPVEVEAEEFTFLGYSLFRLGNEAHASALAAIEDGSVGFDSDEATLNNNRRCRRRIHALQRTRTRSKIEGAQQLDDLGTPAIS